MNLFQAATRRNISRIRLTPTFYFAPSELNRAWTLTWGVALRTGSPAEHLGWGVRLSYSAPSPLGGVIRRDRLPNRKGQL
jgi:hypothetical protein